MNISRSMAGMGDLIQTKMSQACLLVFITIWLGSFMPWKGGAEPHVLAQTRPSAYVQTDRLLRVVRSGVVNLDSQFLNDRGWFADSFLGPMPTAGAGVRRELIKVESKDPVFLGSVVRAYDEEGRLESFLRRDITGDFYRHEVIVRGEKGKIEAIKGLDDRGALLRSEVYNRDSLGRVLEHRVESDGGELLQVLKYAYLDDGHLFSSVQVFRQEDEWGFLSAGGQARNYAVTFSAGGVQGSVLIDAGGSRERVIARIERSLDGRVEDVWVVNGDSEEVLERSIYDRQGRVLSKRSFNEEGHCVSVLANQYVANGQLVLSSWMSIDGESIERNRGRTTEWGLNGEATRTVEISCTEAGGQVKFREFRIRNKPGGAFIDHYVYSPGKGGHIERVVSREFE